MFILRHVPSALLTVGLMCLAVPVAAQPQTRQTLYDRYTEPIGIYHDRARHVHQADLLVEQGGPGVLRSGLPDDVRVREARSRAVVSRGVEARSGLRHLLLGRGVGVGVVPERADDRRGGAARVCRRAEGAVAEGAAPTRRSGR